MPPSAAPEGERVGWIFESSATSAPASNASIAARMPAQPAPTMSTSCFASTIEEAIERAASKRFGTAAPGNILPVPASTRGALGVAKMLFRLPQAKRVIENPTAEEVKELAAKMPTACRTKFGNLN